MFSEICIQGKHMHTYWIRDLIEGKRYRKAINFFIFSIIQSLGTCGSFSVFEILLKARLKETFFYIKIMLGAMSSWQRQLTGYGLPDLRCSGFEMEITFSLFSSDFHLKNFAGIMIYRHLSTKQMQLHISIFLKHQYLPVLAD